jgi:hypothetical protein
MKGLVNQASGVKPFQATYVDTTLTLVPNVDAGQFVYSNEAVTIKDNIGGIGGIDHNTKLMLHFNGTDASTIFTDSSLSPKTVTRVGDTQINTAQSKFGGASAYFDGNGDCLTLADSNDWYWNSVDFTVDFWIRLGAGNAEHYLFGQSTAASLASSCSVWGRINTNGAVFFGYSDGSNYYGQATTFTITDTTSWHHLAFVKYGNSLRIYIDGVIKSTEDMTGKTINNSAALFGIGSLGEYAVSRLYGYIDEFRISVGIARWTADFTPPSSEYTIEQIIPAIDQATTVSEITVVSSGQLKTLGAAMKRYMGFVSNKEVGTI